MMKAPRLLLLLFLALACALVFAVVTRPASYRAALVAAPGYRMVVATAPQTRGEIIHRTIQKLTDSRPCRHELLGWGADQALYYRVSCRGLSDNAGVWVFMPDSDAPPVRVSEVPPDLHAPPTQSILGWLRAPRFWFQDSEGEMIARRNYLRVPQLSSPDGTWVAFIASTLYGPEDVAVIQPDEAP